MVLHMQHWPLPAAVRLGAQAKVLQGHVRETRMVVPEALARFRAELDATLAALV